MPTKRKRSGIPKGSKQESRRPLDQNQQKSRGQAGSHGTPGGPKGSHPDKHGGSGAGRQQGGSGSGRER